MPVKLYTTGTERFSCREGSLLVACRVDDGLSGRNTDGSDPRPVTRTETTIYITYQVANRHRAVRDATDTHMHVRVVHGVVSPTATAAGVATR